MTKMCWGSAFGEGRANVLVRLNTSVKNQHRVSLGPVTGANCLHGDDLMVQYPAEKPLPHLEDTLVIFWEEPLFGPRICFDLSDQSICTLILAARAPRSGHVSLLQPLSIPVLVCWVLCRDCKLVMEITWLVIHATEAGGTSQKLSLSPKQPITKP